MAIRKTIELKDLSDKEWSKLDIARNHLPKTKPFKIFIVDNFPLATLSQRGYLFGVVLKIISEDTGEEVHRLYELFKQEFGDPSYVEEVAIGKWRLSTKLYNTKVMGKFTEKIVAWGRGNGYIIPDPNEIPMEAYLKYLI